MKPKYMIGFFSVLVILLCILSAGYRISYSHGVEKQAALEKSAADARNIEAEIVSDEGTDAEDAGGYCLRELQGYVAVYRNSDGGLYELTDIQVSDLPEEIQQEIAAGTVRLSRELFQLNLDEQGQIVYNTLRHAEE